MFQEPIRGIRHPRTDTTILYFEPDEQDENGTVGEFFVRGGVAWPMTLDPETQRVEGFALILGMNIATGVSYIFDETPFICIDHILNRDRTVRHKGIIDWFSRAWTLYACETFYYYQPEQTHRKWLRQIENSPMIRERPSFFEVPWSDNHQSELLIYEHTSRGELKTYQNEGLENALNNHKPQSAQKPHAAVWALMCVLNGIERFPWHKPPPPDSLPDVWVNSE